MNPSWCHDRPILVDLRWRLRRQRWRPLARASQSVIDEFLQFDLTTICFFLQHVLDHFHFGRSHLKMLAVCNEFLGKTFFNIGKTSSTCTSIWMFPKIVGFPPNHPLKNRVFHYLNHLFLGTPIFGNTHIPLLCFFCCTFSIFPWSHPSLRTWSWPCVLWPNSKCSRCHRWNVPTEGVPISLENWVPSIEEMGPCFFWSVSALSCFACCF